MLLFHGGLPRSGKSFEAVKYHLVPALQKGRKVYARINGLNYEQLAELAGIPLERCRELLIHLTEEAVRGLETLTFDTGSLLILDEVQNFWPDSRKNLNPQLTQFVSEHGHKGLDILLMGQEFKDMHKLWKNRVSQRVQFRKLDMLGKGEEYAWILYKASDPQKFEKISSGTKQYDKAYYGSYASFVPGAEETQLYDDSRANIWKSAMFRRWLPLFGVLLLVAVGYLVYLFAGGGLAKDLKANQPEKKPPTVASSPKAAPAPQPKNSQVEVPAGAIAEKRPDIGDMKAGKDYVTELNEKYRIRLTGVIISRTKQTAMIEWFDESLRVIERLDMLTLARMGYAVTIAPDMQTATLKKGLVRYYATQFPLESSSRISDQKLQQISRESRVAAPAPSPSVAVMGGQDGYGVLGKVGPGVREPGTQADLQTQAPSADQPRPRVRPDSPWRAS